MYISHITAIAITHSLLFVVLALVLILLIYQTSKVSGTSVAIIYGCGAFCEFWFYLCCCYGCCFDKMEDYVSGMNRKDDVLLKESTNMSINSVRTHTVGSFVSIKSFKRIDQSENLHNVTICNDLPPVIAE